MLAVLVLFFIAFCSCDIKVLFYTQKDCKGDHSSVTLKSGECKKEVDESYEYGCTSTGKYKSTTYTDDKCKSGAKTETASGGCENNAAGSVKLSGCKNSVGIALGIIIPILLICCCCCIIILAVVGGVVFYILYKKRAGGDAGSAYN